MSNAGDFPQPLLILGMHRSGTSCLAGSLQEAGLYLGEVNTQAGHNLKGNRENLRAMELHERILVAADGSWDNPPAEPPGWTSLQLKELTSIIADFPSDRQWGLKDPRMLFALNGWLTVTRPRFIGTFRHPVEACQSLLHRASAWKKPMPLETAFGLWQKYNQRLLELRADWEFDIIRYDIDIFDYVSKLNTACRRLGLELPEQPTFRDSRLHNQQQLDTQVPQALAATWKALNDIAL